MDRVWVLTYEVDTYNQYDEYFVSLFKNKPTKDGLKKAMGKEFHKEELLKELLENHSTSYYSDVAFHLHEEGFQDEVNIRY